MPSLPPQVQKFVGDVDKRLHEPGTITNVLATIEKKDRRKASTHSCWSCCIPRTLLAVRTLGAIAVQLDRISLPGIHFNQGNRVSLEGRRHSVADLLGGVCTSERGRVLFERHYALLPILLAC